jgi:uncharacterized protein DUF1844
MSDVTPSPQVTDDPAEPADTGADPAHRTADGPAPAVPADQAEREQPPDFYALTRDIADVPAVEVITTVAVHLMSAAAVHLGLAEGVEDRKDLDEARKLIHALAGLVDAGGTEIGAFHAAPLRNGLTSLQLAFREASQVPDEPGQGPGEKYTGTMSVFV